MPSTLGELSPEDTKALLEFVQENLVLNWDAHCDFSHSTIDFNGPDDPSNIKCDETEEHKYLEDIGRILANVR